MLDWHARFTRQAAWTRELRRSLYTRAGLKDARRVLDVGCGTGILCQELADLSHAQVVGIDLNNAWLSFSRRNRVQASFICADAHFSPFQTESFDLVLCHYLLLWVRSAMRVMDEMTRLARPGGYVLALAEPDYGGRIDFPPLLAELGSLQAEALRRQGADPLAGRQVSGLFHKAGLKSVETGVIGGRWSQSPGRDESDSEWALLENDLSGSLSPADLQRLRSLETAAWQRGERVLYVPTFYAIGQK